MESTERRTPELSREQWSLILELTERELAQLPVEIHHSATRRMRETLRERLKLIEHIRDEVRPYAAELEALP